MPLYKQKVGDLITYSEFEKILINLEVYKFKMLPNFTANNTYTWGINIRDHFNIPYDLAYHYEYGGILIPYRSYQEGGWFPVFNRWWTTQNISTSGYATFTFNKSAAGYWGTPYNQKWFTCVIWCKPLSSTAKKRELPEELFKTDRKVGELVTWLSAYNAQLSTTSDTVKNTRFVPVDGGFTNIPFKEFFPNFDINIHKVSVCPSIQSLYTIENYGAPADGRQTINDDWEWLDVWHDELSKGRPIEFLMFKGIR